MIIQQSFKSEDERKQYFDNTPIHISANEFGIDDFRMRQPEGIRTQQSYSVHIVLRGKGQFQHAEKLYNVDEGTVVITYPGIRLRFWVDEGDPLKYFWIMFNGNSALDLINACNFSIDNPVYKLKDFIPVRSMIEELNAEDMYSTDFRLKTLSVLFDIFQYIKKERCLIPRKQKFSKKNYMPDIVKCIEENYSDPSFRIGDIPKMLNLSHSYICQLFKRYSTITASRYLLIYRIKAAQVLLEKTDKKIQSVALEVGFLNFSYFCKIFKEISGRTPEEYRKYQYKNKRE